MSEALSAVLKLFHSWAIKLNSAHYCRGKDTFQVFMYGFTSTFFVLFKKETYVKAIEILMKISISSILMKKVHHLLPFTSVREVSCGLNGGVGDMERILMIGGDESVRDSLALTLEWAGYDVSEAASAREALAFHQQNPASVIVANDLDADEEGLEHIQALRSHSPTLPIITMSGTIPSSDQEQTSISHILGSVYCLQKPFTMDEFLATIQTALPRFSHS